MATREILSLDESTPQILAPQTGDTYLAPRTITITPETNTSGLVINGGTITADSPVLNLTQTWNNAAVTFTGLKFNVPTDSSASGSLLMDLQVGGSSKFKVTKSGAFTFGDFGVAGLNGMQYSGGVLSLSRQSGGQTTITLSPDSNAISAGTLVSTNGSFNLQSDLFLFRDAAGTLAQRNAANAQTFRIYNTYTDATNTFERGKIAWESNVLRIGTEKGVLGGTARDLELQTDGTTRLTINSAGQLISGISGTAAAPSLVLSGTDTGFFSATVGAVGFGSGGNESFRLEGILGFGLRSSGLLWWTSTANGAYSNRDTILARDAAGTLAQRNAANAQTFRLYGTADGSPGSNYRRLALTSTTAGAFTLSAEGLGTGATGNSLEFATDGTTRLTISATGDIGVRTAPVTNYGVVIGGAAATADLLLTGNGLQIGTAGNISAQFSGNLRMRGGLVITWNDGTTSAPGTNIDLILARDAAGTLAQRQGANAQESRVYGSYTSATNYQRTSVKTVRESSGALSGASYTTTISIPAYANLIGVTTRVTTDITGATTYDVGDGSDVDLWGAAIGITAGTASRTADFTAVGAVGAAATSRTITLTANGSNFTGGEVEICAHYLFTEAD